jgi:hypothetical protein
MNIAAFLLLLLAPNLVIVFFVVPAILDPLSAILGSAR